MSAAFDKRVAEARAHFGIREVKAVDWEAVDAALFARIEKDERADRARFSPPARRGFTVAAVTFAAAAGLVAVLAGKSRDALDADVSATAEGAGTIVAIDADGRDDSLLIDGKPAVRGAALRLGDVLETRGSRATLERAGKLTATLEPGSRTVVTHVHGALVLALERGAVEAQVVPVTSGEAFAVDVDGSRVAVHGTHLRVARDGERVVVDLNEGVVAVGEAPRAGSVLGTLVNAPAHVEFTANDPLGTLSQTHEPSAVRRPAESRAAAVVERPLGSARPASTGPRPSAPVSNEPRPDAHPPLVSSGPAKLVVSKVEPSPEESIAQAVRACMAERLHPENVTVVVSTTLHLDLADDGAVRTARFEPPVAPDVNTCAAQAIFHARFTHGGAAVIAVDFTN
ncbi:MAG TPA: FecR domain-containing protein [Polyangiaceae bacterium]